jgi:hypothetical protein
MLIRCPECDRKLRLPDGEKPRTVRCPDCQATFQTKDTKSGDDAASRRDRDGPERRATATRSPQRPRDRHDELSKDDHDEPKPASRRRRSFDDGGERPTRRRARKSSKGLIGQICLLVYVPIGLVLLLASPFYDVAAVLGSLIAALGIFGGVVMVYVVVLRERGHFEWDHLPWFLRGGVVLLIFQVKYAIEMPRIVASWVGIEFFGFLLLIVSLVCINTVHYQSVVMNNPATTQPVAPTQPGPKPEPAKKMSELEQAIANLDSPMEATFREGAEALARMRPDEAQRGRVNQKLVAHARDTGVFSRRAVIHALGVWATAEQIPVLVEFLSDPDSANRNQTLEFIGKFKDARTVAPVVRCFEGGSTQIAAAKTLREMGPIAEKEVLALLKRDDFGSAVEAITILRDIGTQQSVPELERIKAKKDGRTEGWATEALKAIAARK